MEDSPVKHGPRGARVLASVQRTIRRTPYPRPASDAATESGKACPHTRTPSKIYIHGKSFRSRLQDLSAKRTTPDPGPFPVGKFRPLGVAFPYTFPDRENSLAPRRNLPIISRTGNEESHDIHSLPATVGDALRAARKQLGLTQPQLALAAGVGVRFIVDLEAGKPTVRLENVLRVIDALGGELQLGGLPAVEADQASEGSGHDA